MKLTRPNDARFRAFSSSWRGCQPLVSGHHRLTERTERSFPEYDQYGRQRVSVAFAPIPAESSMPVGILGPAVPHPWAATSLAAPVNPASFPMFHPNPFHAWVTRCSLSHPLRLEVPRYSPSQRHSEPIQYHRSQRGFRLSKSEKHVSRPDLCTPPVYTKHANLNSNRWTTVVPLPDEV